MKYSKNSSHLSLRKKIVQLLRSQNGKVNIGELENLLVLKECEQSCKQIFLQEKKRFKRRITKARRQCRQTKYRYLVDDQLLETETMSPPSPQFNNIFAPSDDPLFYQGSIFEDLFTVTTQSNNVNDWQAWEDFCDEQEVQLNSFSSSHPPRSEKRSFDTAFPIPTESLLHLSPITPLPIST